MFTKDVELALDNIQAEVELMREAIEAGRLNEADVEAGLRFIRSQANAIKRATRLQGRVDAEMMEHDEARAA